MATIEKSELGEYFYICEGNAVWTDDDGNEMTFGTYEEAEDFLKVYAEERI